MAVQIKRKNLRRLASLSALGAGALGAGTANADIVHVAVNQDLNRGDYIHLPGGSVIGVNLSVFVAFTFVAQGSFRFFAGTKASGPFLTGDYGEGGANGGLTTRVAFLSNPRHDHYHFSGPFVSFNDRFRYFLFQFPADSKTLHGWGQLDVVRGATILPIPEIYLVDYAYETTGALIATGQTVPGVLPPVVPEPSEAIPLALSALVLGAAGVRRWRKAKAA